MSIQSALCTGISEVNPCIYQYFHCKCQGACLLEDLRKPPWEVRRCSLVQTPSEEANSKPGLVYIIGWVAEKKMTIWKKSLIRKWGNDVVNSREVSSPSVIVLHDIHRNHSMIKLTATLMQNEMRNYTAVRWLLDLFGCLHCGRRLGRPLVAEVLLGAVGKVNEYRLFYDPLNSARGWKASHSAHSIELWRPAAKSITH